MNWIRNKKRKRIHHRPKQRLRCQVLLHLSVCGIPNSSVNIITSRMSRQSPGKVAHFLQKRQKKRRTEGVLPTQIQPNSRHSGRNTERDESTKRALLHDWLLIPNDERYRGALHCFEFFSHRCCWATARCRHCTNGKQAVSAGSKVLLRIRLRAKDGKLGGRRRRRGRYECSSLLWWQSDWCSIPSAGPLSTPPA